ncbi:MAG: hypothetical protein WAK96_06265, partial [Desulfobaccales bacterium]
MIEIMENTRLSKSITVAEYRNLEAQKDRNKIANFILDRFTERYIIPLRVNCTQKHGFCTMAISCLMIEALESFWQGWSDTHKKSRKAFDLFFKRCSEQNNELKVFYKQSNDFYTDVRCAILHQAETTNGWRICRHGPLFTLDNKTINATKFHDQLQNCLKNY